MKKMDRETMLVYAKQMQKVISICVKTSDKINLKFNGETLCINKEFKLGETLPICNRNFKRKINLIGFMGRILLIN